MSHYYREHSFHKKSRFLQRFRIFIILCVVLVIAAGGFLLVDSIILKRKTVIPSKPTTETKAAIVSSIDIFKTQHFQFQASKKWIFVANESTDTKFVYRYLRETLVEHALTIYVNDPSEKDSASRLLLVSQTEASLKAGELSEHCKTLLPKDARNVKQQANFKGATFMCTPDSQEYSIVLGMNGQDASALRLKRPDGSDVTYSIVYQNLTISPNTREIYDIAGSFQVR